MARVAQAGGCGMNRAQRRASQFKRGLRTDRNAMAEPSSVLTPLIWSTVFTTEEVGTLSSEVRLAWHHLTHGSGTQQHFQMLAMAMNTCLVRCEAIGNGEAAEEVARRAQAALVAMQARHRRTGRFGPDAQALQDVPYALDLYDELLRNSTPLQMHDATKEALARELRGYVAAEEQAY